MPGSNIPRSVSDPFSRATLALAALGLAGCWVFALVPSWPIALLQHFRVQFAIFGVLVTISAAVARTRAFDIAAIATLLHWLVLLPDLGREPQPVPPRARPLRVLELNVLTENMSYDRVRALIAETQPDVIGLVEVDRGWLEALAPALVEYPGRIEVPRSDHFGLALYARGIAVGGAEQLGLPLPSIVADIAVGDARVAIVLAHPLAPVDAWKLDGQRVQLAAIAQRVRELAPPVAIVGDLNTTPWTPEFKRLVATSELCDTRSGFGVQASFPATSFVARIPIDHVLASCSVGVYDRRVLHDVGSDHLPVVIDLAIPR